MWLCYLFLRFQILKSFTYIVCTFPVDVDLQRKLLDPNHASCELDEGTLQQLADTIGDKWASIAPLLSFTTAEIEQFRSEDCPAQVMLQKLKEKGILTHEQLCSRLRTISLLKSPIWVSSHFRVQFVVLLLLLFLFLLQCLFVICLGHNSVVFV